MYSKLGEAIVNKNKKRIKEIIASLDYTDLNLADFVNEMAPVMLTEANLTYGNFHFIKMALFLRELSINNYFSSFTEKELINLLAINMTERRFIKVEADRIGYKEDYADQSTLKSMIEEIDKGNIHNAYYYSLGLLKYKPEMLKNNLLVLGTESLSKTLGHSFTCFYPVMRDLVVENSRYDTNSIFSYIMYLSRFNYRNDVHIQFDTDHFEDISKLIEVCASGEGIINLHHMITLAVYLLWEKDENNGVYIPYHNFLNWIGDKEVDKKQKEKIENMETREYNLGTYEEFENTFLLKNLDDTFPVYLNVLEKDYNKAVDWMFRLYTNYYKPNWDPHYFTSLYSALKLYEMDKSENKTPSKMAVYQAIRYFAQRIDLKTK
ncbi:MAG: hypothetical protein U5K53_07055 [Halanaerobiales bacterium]|nr:hypothetical protein [Halanaerobiales bacterium]